MLDSNNRESRNYNIVENENNTKNYWINRLIAWWSGFSLRTKLLATNSVTFPDSNNPRSLAYLVSFIPASL